MSIRKYQSSFVRADNLSWLSPPFKHKTLILIFPPCENVSAHITSLVTVCCSIVVELVWKRWSPRANTQFYSLTGPHYMWDGNPNLKTAPTTVISSFSWYPLLSAGFCSLPSFPPMGVLGILVYCLFVHLTSFILCLASSNVSNPNPSLPDCLWDSDFTLFCRVSSTDFIADRFTLCTWETGSTIE